MGSADARRAERRRSRGRDAVVALPMLPPGAADPLFIGGTGRSGTHAIAKLIGKSSTYFYVSRELRFHTDRGGIPDLLDGRIDLERFLENMRGYYWQRPGADGRSRGLHSKFKRKRFEAALGDFESRFEDDAAAACAGLLRALVDPLAADAGKPSWIEQTPRTAAAAATLAAIFPSMKLVHMVRDGRDVACSVATQAWGPGSPRRGVAWWERRLREAHAGAAALPAEQVLTLQLEDLVATDREVSYARLLTFLGLDDERGLRRHFDKRMSAEAGHLARWHELRPRRRRALDRAYVAALERLRADGIDYAPDPEAIEH